MTLPTIGVPASGARRLLHVAVVLVWGLLATACAHNVLYDENRDKQGQDAKKVIAEAHLATVIASLEKAFSDLAAREEARARDRAAYLFELELKVVSRAPSLGSKFDDASGVDGLQTVAQARLAKFGLRDPAAKQLDDLIRLDLRKRARQNALEVTRAEFRGVIARPLDNCTAVYASSAKPLLKSDVPAQQFMAGVASSQRMLVRTKFKALVDACKALDEVETEILGAFAPDGDIKVFGAKANDIEQDALKYAAAQQDARDTLKAEIAKYNASGTNAASKPGESTLAALEMQALALRNLVKLLAAGTSAFGAAGQQVIAAEKLDKLETLLGVIAGSTDEARAKLSVDEQVAVAIVRDLPALADEADKLLSEAKKPRVTPFLVAVEQQKLVLKGFEAAEAIKRKQADAVRHQMGAALNEAMALVRVLFPFAKNESWIMQSIRDLETSLSPKDKPELYRALARYADEVQQYRMEIAIWGARERAARYEEGLVLSKSTVARWDSLTSTIATVLADYEAAGIKKADLAEFFKALGLVVIGMGVAQ